MRRNYPECLPKQRREQKQMELWRALPGQEDPDGDGAPRTASSRPAARA